MFTATPARLFRILAFSLLLFLPVSLLFGATFLDIGQLLVTQSVEREILFNLRLPRGLAAALTGFALAISGVAIQGVFRNPLAEPALIGVSSGAAFTAAVALLVLPAGLLWLDLYIALAAFVGGVLVCFLIYLFFALTRAQDYSLLLLVGIAINALLAAGIGLLNFVAESDQLRQLFFWTMGGFSATGWSSVLVLIIIVLPASVIIFRQAQALNAMLLGMREATHLGFDTKWKIRIVLILVALVVGATVAVAGIISFVGLIIPHICRRLVGPDHRVLLPIAGLAGALLMLLTDMLARSVIAPAEIPVGLITALIGAPFFLWLLISRRGLV